MSQDGLTGPIAGDMGTKFPSSEAECGYMDCFRESAISVEIRAEKRTEVCVRQLLQIFQDKRLLRLG